jgi:hypothetical protein
MTSEVPLGLDVVNFIVFKNNKKKLFRDLFALSGLGG